MFCYIHIPFCRQKCAYCKFALTPFVRDAQIQCYLGFLRSEINTALLGIGENRQGAQSLYFGGGTPSVLSPLQIASISELFRGFTVSDFEFTLEANPEDITKDWLEGVMRLGVNRISLGVQSLENDTLQTIGRGGAAGIYSALDALEEAGFTNVNVDFIIGLPKVSPGQVLQNIQQLQTKYTCIKHTSVYFLEKGEYPKQWEQYSMTEEEQRNEYASIRAYLLQKNWNHYEISNFSAKGYECKHNRAYWNHSHVLGFGLSAAGFIPSQDAQKTSNNPQLEKLQYLGRRMENSHTFSGYYRGEKMYDECLSDQAIALEAGMFQLRTFCLPYDSTCPGIDKAQRERIISENSLNGYILQKNGNILPTTEGIFVIDKLMEELL